MITPSVDLRAALHAVRDQGRRKSCLAFAISAAHEHLGPYSYLLSIEFLFYHAVARMPGADPHAGVSMQAVSEALVNDGQPPEDCWPYLSSQMLAPIWAPPASPTPIHKAIAQLTPLAFANVCQVLDTGRPVVLGLLITDAFRQPTGDGIVPDNAPDATRGGHAVLAVGYGTDSTSGVSYLLIRNSWGLAWGTSGHAWLSAEYVQRQLRETAVLC